jgi:hypothetical protein
VTTFFCLVILAGVVGAAVVADVWARRVAARDRAQPRFLRLASEGDPPPPASVNAFMGREPDTSINGYAVWVTDDGDLAWCPYVRPSVPTDGEQN